MFVKHSFGQVTGTSLSISSCDVVLWTELIFKKGFRGKTTCRTILNCVLSLNLQMATRILILCIANTRRIVLHSRSLIHNTTSSGHFGRAIFESKIEQFSGVIKLPIFFKHDSNFRIVYKGNRLQG